MDSHECRGIMRFEVTIIRRGYGNLEHRRGLAYPGDRIKGNPVKKGREGRDRFLS